MKSLMESLINTVIGYWFEELVALFFASLTVGIIYAAIDEIKYQIMKGRSR